MSREIKDTKDTREMKDTGGIRDAMEVKDTGDIGETFEEKDNGDAAGVNNTRDAAGKENFKDLELKKWKKLSLYTKFGRMFLIVLIVAALITGFVAYSMQDNIYHNQFAAELRNLNNFVVSKILEEGEDFRWLQNWFKEHRDELEIPFQYPDNASAEKAAFEQAFISRCPGQVFGRDVTAGQLDADLQLLYARYLFLKWLTTFDKVRDEYNLVFAYYVYPTPDMKDYMCYMFDAPREEEIVDGKSLLVVGFDAYQERVKMHPNMWKAYETGKDPMAMDVYENEYGHVLTYATPVVYEGEVLGVFMTDIGYSFVEGRIRQAALLFAGLSLLVLGACFLMILFFVRRTILEPRLKRTLRGMGKRKIR